MLNPRGPDEPDGMSLTGRFVVAGWWLCLIAELALIVFALSLPDPSKVNLWQSFPRAEHGTAVGF